MKRFLKNASIYILLMILIAAVIFSLNYFYGEKISQDLETDIRQSAAENDYQIRFIEIDTNPLLKTMNVINLNLTKADQFNLIVNQAEINFSWQQIINYFRNGSFQFDKNFKSQIMQINYSNLQDNYQLNFSEAELNYQGDFELQELNDPEAFLAENHSLDFKTEELKYDFPYYRSYGLNSENWNRLSTFNNFNLKADYTKENKNLIIDQFNLKGELLTIIFDLESELEYLDDKDEKIVFLDPKNSFDFLLLGEELEFEENSFFEDLSFKQLDFNGNLDLVLEDQYYSANQADFDLNLSDFKLLLSEELSLQLNQNTFGILAQDKQFELAVDSFSYEQQYNKPNGTSSADLKSSIVDGSLMAEINYSEEIPYLSNAKLRYKPKTQTAEQLNSFLQLILGRSFERDDEDYFVVEVWGSINDLNYE